MYKLAASCAVLVDIQMKPGKLTRFSVKIASQENGQTKVLLSVNCAQQVNTPKRIHVLVANSALQENFQTRLGKSRAQFATQENGQTSWVLLIATNVVKAGTLWKLVLPQTYVKSVALASMRMKKEQAHAKIVNQKDH